MKVIEFGKSLDELVKSMEVTLRVQAEDECKVGRDI